MTLISHSNLEGGLFYLLAFEWGLTEVEAVAPAFAGKSKGKTNKYCVSILDHKDSVIAIPDKGYCDYYIVVITNKRGDNLILLKGDVRGESLTFQELVPRIMWKTQVEVSEYTDSLL